MAIKTSPTPTTYELDRIADLLKVPTDRRSECLRNLEYALDLHELALGEKAADVDVGTFRWTDDGNNSCTLSSGGAALLTLEVTEEASGPGPVTGDMVREAIAHAPFDLGRGLAYFAWVADRLNAAIADPATVCECCGATAAGGYSLDPINS